VGNDVVLIDPAVAVAAELTRRLGNDRRMDDPHVGATRFFTTGDVSHVQQVVAHLWGDGAVVEDMGQ
jgi:glutamate racemase